jgi:anti-sigma factor RsiW
MECAEALQVQAYTDSEVDGFAAVAIERHLSQCEECRTMHLDLLKLRIALRWVLPYFHTRPALRAELTRILDHEGAGDRVRQQRFERGTRRTPSFWLGAIGSLGAAGVATALAFFLMAPAYTGPVVDELLDAHISSLMSSHLTDVVPTINHTMKPWFAGRADVSPLVVDLESKGYKVIGGRVAYLQHQRAAVVVYQGSGHVIDVFSWATVGQSLARQVAREGYHLMFWQSGNLEYCAVSDTAWDELLGMVQLMQQTAASEPR